MGKRNIVGHCYRPSRNNDKVYIVSIRETPDFLPNQSGKFLVLTKWCRRGKNPSVSVRGTHNSLAAAQAHQLGLWQSQLKGGYLDIESLEYRDHMANEGVRPLTLSDPQISTHLEKEDGISAAPKITVWQCERCGEDWEPKQNSKGRVETQNNVCPDCLKAVRAAAMNAASKARGEDEVLEDEVLVCSNNSGMEDRFDIGIEYLVEDHPDKDMVYVYNKLGRKDECFRIRFMSPEQWAKKQGRRLLSSCRCSPA